MQVTKPFPPLVLTLIGVLLGITTGALVLVARQAAQTDSPAAHVTASVTADSLLTPSETATPVPTQIITSTPRPTVGTTPTRAVTASPVATAAPLPSPVAARPVVAAGWRAVQIDSAGIGLQVPEDWEKLPDVWSWSPDGSDDLQIGLTWTQPDDGWAPSTMLPPGADRYETKPVNLGWSRGTSYLVEVPGEINTVERHVIVRVDDELAVDFYARAATTEELGALETILERMLKSIIVNAYTGDPVDVSVQFLGALLGNTDPSGYLSLRLRQVVKDGRPVLSLLGVENLYSSFSVSLASASDGRMAVQADLDYGAGRVEERLLILVEQDGTWRIDDITNPGKS